MCDGRRSEMTRAYSVYRQRGYKADSHNDGLSEGRALD